MVKHLLALLVIFSCGVGARAHAEGGCPPGQYPQQGQGWHSCVPVPGGNAATSEPTSGPAWRNSWQAVAADIPKGILGSAVGKLSPMEAQDAALDDCKAKGGTNCVLQMSHGNGCIAMAVGSSRLRIISAPSQGKAEKSAMAACSAEDTACKIFYSECSLPVKMR